MKKPTLQKLRVFMFPVLALLFSADSLGQYAQAAESAYKLEQTSINEQQKAKENSSSEKARLKKRGRVRIATLGPRPFPIDANMEPRKIVEKAIEHWRYKFSQVLADRPDLIIVPEACDRPSNFPRDKRLEYYRVRKNKVRDFFVKVAKENHCYIVYSAAREIEDGTWRNSSVLIDRKGDIAGIYNKNHVVVEETTEYGILCGSDAPVFECDFGRVAFAICFDLNFDELRMKYVKAKPDLIIFSSMYHGGLMQAYWAYSCRCHFAGAVAGLPSEIRNPLGQVIASTTNYFDYVVADVNLDCRLVHLDYNWSRLRLLKSKYGSKVTITDPGFLGAVLISSEDEEISVDEMIKEFEIELLDDYMARALAHRHKPGNME
ncbi:MAG: carbon-nitrogen hydrolase family protein [Gemmatimonadota bacterium]|nr:carbon-nitrogen hydrolase family protein [Gemmatimonadota bacterium]